MANRDTDTRTCTLVDLPLIRRISDRAMVLDTELEYTRDPGEPMGAIISSILLPQRHLHTLISRADKHQVIGQLRLRADERSAQIVYIAPGPKYDTDDTAWLHVLDAMAYEAGRQSATVLIGEINEDCALFETMRHSGFAVYARQQIWRRMPGDYAYLEPPVQVRAATADDTFDIQKLVTHVVPRLLRMISDPLDKHPGWVYERDGRVEAYIAVSTGRHGIYLMPYINPDVLGQTPGIFHGVIQQLQKASKLPVYVRVRRHQEWLATALEALQFEPGPRQALMVRHLTARVRQTRYRLERKGIEVVPNSATPLHLPVYEYRRVIKFREVVRETYGKTHHR
ncbi:MAG: hypothetical protein ACOCYT_04180 [Chloroflexota bacterium]